jgi:hypothetical protein
MFNISVVTHQNDGEYGQATDEGEKIIQTQQPTGQRREDELSPTNGSSTECKHNELSNTPFGPDSQEPGKESE